MEVDEGDDWEKVGGRLGRRPSETFDSWKSLLNTARACPSSTVKQLPAGVLIYL